MNTVAQSTALAKEMVSGGYRYLYGGKGQNYTKALVQRLAKENPKTYTASLIKEALKDADKGFKAIDCSGFVCKALGIPNMGSGQIKSTAVEVLPVTKANAKEGMAIWKQGHIAYVGDGLKIYEAKSTAADMAVTSWEKRASAFSYLLVVKGSALASAPKVEKPVAPVINKPMVASPTIKKGVKGIHAKYLQQDLNYLHNIGYIKLDAILKEDGDCGSKTVEAIKVFQKKVGFKGNDIDGSYGPATYAKMKALLG